MQREMEMAQKAHFAHMDVDLCSRHARETLFWLDVNKHIKEIVENCSVCLSQKDRQQKELLQPHEPPTERWQKVGVDLCNFEGITYLVTVDYFSNFIEVDNLARDSTTTAVITKLRGNFSRHGNGIPTKLCSNGGPQFSSEMFKLFSEKFKFGTCDD